MSENDARQGLHGIWPHVERFLHLRTDLVLARVAPPPGDSRAGIDANAYPGSFLIAADVDREPGLVLTAAGLAIPYHRIRFARLLCPPFDAWLGERHGLAGGAGAWVADATVYVDDGRLARAADALVFDRIADLQAAARRVEGGASGLAALSPAERVRVLKDGLRWRSLEGFWAEVEPLGHAERRARFAERRGLELAEAAILADHFGSLARIGSASDARAAEAAALVATLDGCDPLGALATIVGLWARGEPSAERALAAIGPLVGAARAAGARPGAPIAGWAASLAGASEADLRDAARQLASGGAAALLGRLGAAEPAAPRLGTVPGRTAPPP